MYTHDHTGDTAAQSTVKDDGDAFEKFRVRAWVWLQNPKTGGRPERAVWRELLKMSGSKLSRMLAGFLLQSYADRNGETYVSARTICNDCGLHITTVQGAIREMRRSGLVRSKKLRGASRHVLNVQALTDAEIMRSGWPSEIVNSGPETRSNAGLKPGLEGPTEEGLYSDG